MDLSKEQHKLSKKDKLNRKVAAKQLLDNPLIKEFFEIGAEKLFRQWRNPTDEKGEYATPEYRERIYLRLSALVEFQQFFTMMINEGTMVEREIRDAEKKLS